ncbi:MAG: hypothetical protein WB608_08540 [Terracidiphilus sp.]
MFQFLFKYPIPVFTRGHFVLLSTWPAWLLPVFIAIAGGGLALLIRWRLRDAAPRLRSWHAWIVWLMQWATLALLLLLLWQPAITVSELSSQQNIIAVVVDDSRSMATSDVNGRAREDAALAALNGGVLAGLQNRFQTRLYRLDTDIKRIDSTRGITPSGTATRIDDGLKQLVAETSDLPVGAIVLLSDGGQNMAGVGGSGISPDTLQALRNRRLPVHTIGFGREQLAHDVEIEDVSIAEKALANARVSATVTFTQHGYTGEKATLVVRDDNKILEEHQITFGPDGRMQAEPLFFPAGAAGAKNIEFAVQPLDREENLANNAITRPLLVSDEKRRILYIEGEPRWEFKFIRRAEEDDPTVQVVSMLRTSENKVYRQGISDPNELADGFPVRPEDLFTYSGIIIGSVDADYFTPLQQELLREYVDRRGGGVLFLGGRSSLSDGGWAASTLNELLPTFLPAGRNNFHRNPATVELTRAGVDSPITRLLDDPEKNAQRWKKLTYLADYEDAGAPKPGATILASLSAGSRKLPLLVTETYGHGRTAVLATGGTWRWQMSEALGDPSHDLFWHQLLRWLVADTPGPVVASMPARILMDEGRAQLKAQVYDQQFQPAVDAHVTAHVVGPEGVNAFLDLTPSQDAPGTYELDWTAEKPGAYLAEIIAESAGDDPHELGRDVVTFQREDGIAEKFHTNQNRPYLDQLASQTGGRYWKPDDLKNLPRDISYSEAGISVRNTKELWNMPIVFALLLGLPASEWLLRRKWGVV